MLNGPAPQPLSAILLDYDAASDTLHAVGTLGGDLFPQNRIAQRRDAKGRNRFEVREARIVAGFFDLITISVADAHVGAFHAAPDFDILLSALLRHAPNYTAAASLWWAPFNGTRACGQFDWIRLNSARACPTTWSML